jgi:hypothetical protein
MSKRRAEATCSGVLLWTVSVLEKTKLTFKHLSQSSFLGKVC